MLKSRNVHLYLVIILPFLILSCWGDSTPTSDKTGTFKVGGSVTDKNGAGIQGVTVQITGTNYSTADTTDKMGIFAFDSIKSGNYKVKAQKDSCFFKPGNIEFSVVKFDIDTLKFTSADNYIHGRILDIMTDKPAKEVMVTMRTNGTYNENADTTITNSDGEYSFFDKERGSYILNIFTSVSNKNGWNSYMVESKAFSAPEIIIPDNYVSYEKLAITSAIFSEETKTLTIEWTPSKSAYLISYILLRQGYPFNYQGSYTGQTGQTYTKNKLTIKITADYVKYLFDEGLISGVLYFAVFPCYQKGDCHIFNAPLSDEVGVRLSW